MLFDWLAERRHVDPRRIAVVGRSLGSGVAVQVAKERPAHSVVLITPYDSILAIAKRKFRAMPIDYVLRHRFESIKYAPAEGADLCAARRQRRRGAAFAYRLAGGQAGPAACGRIVPGSDHMNIPYLEETQDRIASFLRRPRKG
jgi:dienelactone hydrolase